MAQVNQRLINALVRDVYFFKTRGLLDYSLLFAIEEHEESDIDNELIQIEAKKTLMKASNQLKLEMRQKKAFAELQVHE
jgi:hypothetical protein